MKQGSHRPSRDILSDVQSQFERWCIPETLWQAAVEAADECGVSKTSQAFVLPRSIAQARINAGVAASARLHPTHLR